MSLNNETLFANLVSVVPSNYEWMSQYAASSLAWSGAYRWLMAERNLEVAKNPATIERNEKLQEHWAALIKSVEHLLPTEAGREFDVVQVVEQMLADRKMQPPEDIEAYLKQTAALNHTTVEEERAILKAAINNGVTDEVLKRMRPKAKEIAAKLAHAIETSEERELDVYEIARFANKLAVFLHGDGKLGGNPGALERQRQRNRQAILPAFAQREKGKVEVLLFMADELNTVAEAIADALDEVENGGREVQDDRDGRPMH